MDFAWNAEQETFRSTVRAFLSANLPRDWESLAHGPASEAQSSFSKKFCGKLADAGLLVPHWPKRWGGRDAGAWTAFILAEEMWEAGEPRGGQYMNVNWIGPTLMRFGSEEQQARYIPPMARGQTIWCQGFSEPEAGSDLASLRTRAEKHGSSYRINGQKIWTSYAQHADTCFLLARTSSRTRRHLRVPGADGHARHHRARDPESHRRRRYPRGVLGQRRGAGQCAARRRRAGMGDRAQPRSRSSASAFRASRSQPRCCTGRLRCWSERVASATARSSRPQRLARPARRHASTATASSISGNTACRPARRRAPRGSPR